MQRSFPTLRAAARWLLLAAVSAAAASFCPILCLSAMVFLSPSVVCLRPIRQSPAEYSRMHCNTKSDVM